MRSGKFDGVIVLAEGRTTIDGTMTARGLVTSGVTLARLDAEAKLVNGEGTVREYLAYAKDVAALDFVIVTDHDFANAAPWQMPQGT